VEERAREDHHSRCPDAGGISLRRSSDHGVEGPRGRADFVSRVQSFARPEGTICVMCRSGGRSAIAVNMLAEAGFKQVFQIVDGMEGDVIKDADSVFQGQRLKNGWKNSGCPWTYAPAPERMVLPGDGKKEA
jgi:rhodanese-related sulfurtransferase